MFYVLQGKPEIRTTFCTCIGHFGGDVIDPVQVGALIKFLTPESLFIAKGLSLGVEINARG